MDTEIFIAQAKELLENCETISEKTERVSPGRYKSGEVGLIGNYNLYRSYGETVFDEKFKLEIKVSNNRKAVVPRVWIPEESIPEGFRHIYGEGYICMGTKVEILNAWGDNQTAESFFYEVVDYYLVNLISFRDEGITLTGERPHGEEGILEYYRQYFPNVIDDKHLKKVLKYVNKNKDRRLKNPRSCPCGSTRPTRECCSDYIDSMIAGLDTKKKIALSLDVGIITGSNKEKKRGVDGRKS